MVDRENITFSSEFNWVSFLYSVYFMQFILYNSRTLYEMNEQNGMNEEKFFQLN